MFLAIFFIAGGHLIINNFDVGSWNNLQFKLDENIKDFQIETST